MSGMKALACALSALALGGCVRYAPSPAQEQPLPAAEQQSEWIPVSVAPDGSSSWEVQRGSFLFGKNTHGELIGIANGRVISVVDTRIELLRWHVTLADCARGMGKMGTSDTSDALLGEVDFVFGGGTHASRLAKAICEAAELKAQSMGNEQLPAGRGIAQDDLGI